MVIDSHNNKDYYDLVVLDLGMPISDGYEACMNILKVYDEQRDIMKIVESKQSKPTPKQRKSILSIESSQQIKEERKRESDSESQSELSEEDQEVDQDNDSNINVSDLKPIMIACSGFVDDDVLKRTKDKGFVMTFEAPLKNE